MKIIDLCFQNIELELMKLSVWHIWHYWDEYANYSGCVLEPSYSMKVFA